MAGNGGWTDGPWTARQYRGRWQVDGPLEIICRVNKWSPQVDRADARLIAAAPDGFAAAESAYRLLLRVPHDLPLRFLNQPVYAALRSYIAAALGEDDQTVQDRYEAEARGDQPDSDPPIPNSATPQGA